MCFQGMFDVRGDLGCVDWIVIGVDVVYVQ